MYPHNLSLVFNWTSAIENISDKKLVALSSSKFRARAETFNGVSITVSVHISKVNISNVWLIGICNQSEGRIGIGLIDNFLILLGYRVHTSS